MNAAPDFLTVADLATRWGCSRNSIGARWRDGKIPPPFNLDQAQGWKWHPDVIEAYERGDWRPTAAISSTADAAVTLARLMGGAA